MPDSLVELEQSSLTEAREFERTVRARLEQGESSRADLLKATAQRSQFEQALAQAQLDARMANQILASFWTADVDAEIPLASALDANVEPPPDALEQEAKQAVESRPEFRRFDAIDRTYQAQRKIARAGLRPDASVVFQYGLDANQVRADQRGYAAYVNLNVPIFDWFRSRSGVREANYREQQTEFDRAAAERTFSREYYAARARVQSWHDRIPLARSEFDDSNENLRLVRLLYAAGEGLALDVVQSQVQASQAGQSLYSAIAEYQRALADFEVAAGR